MKNIKYKMKFLNIVVSSLRGRSSLRPAIIQNNSCVYKKNVRHDKNQFIYFFCEKPVSKSVRS